MTKRRTSHTVEKDSTKKYLAMRGRAGASRDGILGPNGILAGRRFRRANRLSHVDAARLQASEREPDDTLVKPAVSVVMDTRTRMILGLHVS